MRTELLRELSIVEGVPWNDERVPKAAVIRIEHEYLSRTVEGEVVTKLTVTELSREKLTDKLELRLVEGRPEGVISHSQGSRCARAMPQSGRSSFRGVAGPTSGLWDEELGVDRISFMAGFSTALLPSLCVAWSGLVAPGRNARSRAVCPMWPVPLLSISLRLAGESSVRPHLAHDMKSRRLAAVRRASSKGGQRITLHGGGRRETPRNSNLSESMGGLDMKPLLMNARTAALQLITGAFLSSSLLVSTAAAIEPELQPIYSNIDSNGLCGTANNLCEVPIGQRLIIEHVSGYVFVTKTTDTATSVSLVVTDPQLGLNGAAFHTFIATKVATTGTTITFAFATPFKMMLNPGASFHFSPANAVAVSGYLVKQ
jgi:hypothetical protein